MSRGADHLFALDEHNEGTEQQLRFGDEIAFFISEPIEGFLTNPISGYVLDVIGLADVCVYAGASMATCWCNRADPYTILI